MMFVATKVQKEKERRSKKSRSKRSRVGTNRRWLKMTLTDEEKLGAISIEIGIVDDYLDRCEKEGIEFLEAMKEEWKVLYHIREILEKWFNYGIG